METITQDVQVGIYDSEYVARIYNDRIVVTAPYVKWIGNTGGYAESKHRITDSAIMAKVKAALTDGADATAWQAIGSYLNDDYLYYCNHS